MKKIMNRFINEDCIKDKNGEQLYDIDIRKNALNAKRIDVGNGARKALVSLSIEHKAEFLSDAKEFYILVTLYLKENLPLKNKLLQSLQVLHPIIRKQPLKDTLPSVRRLANCLPQVIPEDCIDKLTDEWRLYTCDSDILEEWICPNEKPVNSVDSFWSKVFELVSYSTGNFRYPYLMTLVKAALTFSHGQVSVERGFSVNKRMLTSECSRMSLDTIKGLKIIKAAVHGKASDMCVTQEMISFYKDAYRRYNEQKQAESVKTKKTKSSLEVPKKRTAEDKIKGLQDNVTSSQAMIEEDNLRLKIGLKRQCMSDIEAAQALIDAGNKKLKKVRDVE